MKETLRTAIAADSPGRELKEEVLARLKASGLDVTDISQCEEPYYLAAERVCQAVLEGEYDRGVLVSATGQDMNILANKFDGIRSALCFNSYTARLSRIDTRANILCLGAYGSAPEEAARTAEVFLTTRYYGNNQAGLKEIQRFDHENRKK